MSIRLVSPQKVKVVIKRTGEACLNANTGKHSCIKYRNEEKTLQKNDGAGGGEGEEQNPTNLQNHNLWLVNVSHDRLTR